MVLVDTSVWIDFFNNRPGGHVDLLISLLEEDGDICISGVILTEVLQGIRNDEQFRRTQTFFEPLIYLPISRSTWIESAKIYRDLRKSGVTVRKSMDCVIAATALENGVKLLHNDSDFMLIQRVRCLLMEG